MEPKRPTWKSTTFLMIVVVNALTVLGAISQYIPAQTAAILSAILTGIFAACNAWIKVNAVAPAVLPEEPTKPV